MRTGVAFGNLRNSGQRRSVNGCQNFVALLAVVVFHFVDMTFKIAFGDKACQRVLLKAGYGAAVKAHGLLIALQKARRQHHVADAQRWYQAFGEGVHVDDTALRILCVQRQDEASGITEFAVVIILDDVALADAVNPFKKLQPACYGHDDAGGEVVGGGKMHDVGTAFLQLVNHQAVVINRDVLPGIAKAGGDGGEFFITRFFDGEGAGVTKHLQQAAVKIFRTGADDNLRRINLHSAVVCQIVGNSLAQLVDALVGNCFEQLFVVHG